MSRLTHLDEASRPRMVDVGDKDVTRRTAEARGRLRCSAEALALVLAGKAPKGSVINTAEIAGIMAAKRTHELIPLCHPLALSGVKLVIEPDEALPGFHVRASVKLTGKTGVEMEALTAVSVACLTLYDMLKAVDKHMIIENIDVIAKSGGRSGDWTVDDNNMAATSC